MLLLVHVYAVAVFTKINTFWLCWLLCQLMIESIHLPSLQFSGYHIPGSDHLTTVYHGVQSLSLVVLQQQLNNSMAGYRLRGGLWQLSAVARDSNHTRNPKVIL